MQEDLRKARQKTMDAMPSMTLPEAVAAVVSAVPRSPILLREAVTEVAEYTNGQRSGITNAAVMTFTWWLRNTVGRQMLNC
jgi:hypothetical protein